MLGCLVEEKEGTRGTWMAPSVKRLTLNFCSGHDLTVPEVKPWVRFCTDRAEPAWDSVSPSLSVPPPLTLSLSLSK